MTTVVLVQQGGTGSNNASDARSALGAAPTAAYDQANAAFAAANSGSSSAGVAYNQANAAYTQANTARSDANTTFATVNTTFGTVNTSVSTANTQANSGRDQANAAYGQANSAYNAANTAQTTAQNAFSQANTSRDQANSAYNQANTARDQANTARDTANSAYGQANLAYTQANSAFTAANNSNLKSGGIISGTLNVTNDIIVGGNVYLQGNTTFINVSTYQVNDPLMYIAANNILTDSVDIGFVGAKNTSGTFSHTGFARDATDGKYKLFDNLPDAGHVGNVIDFANSTIATLVANVEANTLTLGGNTVATQANLTLAHNQANNAYGQANLAYTAANNRVLKAGDTMTGQLNISSGGLLVTGNTNFDSGTLFVDSVNDRIGIGTNSPSRALTIEKSGAAFPSASNPTIRLNETSSGRFALMELDSSQNLTIWNGDTGSGSIRFYRGSGSGTLSMSLDGSGNVGIGTASPTAKLHVYTTTNYTGNLTFDGVASIGPVLNIEAPGNVYTEFRLGSWALTRAKLRVEGYSGAGSGTGGGTLSLWTGDTSGVQQQRVTIDGVGNVGIGATSPVSRLNIRYPYSGSNVTTFGKVSESHIYLGDPGWNNQYSQITFGYDSTNAAAAFGFLVTDQSGTTKGALVFATRDVTTSTLPTERMRITSAGNVGIGTTTPSAPLDVRTAAGSSAQFNLYSGNNSTTTKISIGQIAAIDWDIGLAASTGHFYIGGLGGSVSEAYRIQRTGTSIDSHLWSTGAGTERMRIDSSGNIGIGATAAAYEKIGVGGTYPTSSNFSQAFVSRGTIPSGTTTSFVGYYSVPSTQAASFTLTSLYHFLAGFSTKGASSVISNQYGFLAGSDLTGASSNYGFYGDIASGSGRWNFYANGTANNYFAGNVGIGTTSPSTKLDVSGTITCTALTETSSITFKENVDPIQNALNSITKLVGVTYDRKDGSAKQKAGLIAEEVNEVLPNLVQKDADGNAYGIHYTNLIAYLVESIKELNNKIERLESNR